MVSTCSPLGRSARQLSWSLAATLPGQLRKHPHSTSFQSSTRLFCPQFQASFCRQHLPVSKQSTALVGGKSCPRFVSPKPVRNNQLAIGTCSAAAITSQDCSSSHPLAFIAIITAATSVGVKVARLASGVSSWLLACFWRSKGDVCPSHHPSTAHSADSCSCGASVKNFLNRLGSVCRENRTRFRLLSSREALSLQKQPIFVALVTVGLRGWPALRKR